MILSRRLFLARRAYAGAHYRNPRDTREMEEARKIREERLRYMKEQEWEARRGKFKEVMVPMQATAKSLSNELQVRVVDVLKLLIKMGFRPVSSTEVIPSDVVDLLCSEFRVQPRRLAPKALLAGGDDMAGPLGRRTPVIALFGHVNHGKTTLFDALSGSRVAAGESGGITQHLRAALIDPTSRSSGGREGGGIPGGSGSSSGAFTLIDTPGHAAFAALRRRGAAAVDVAVLCVAADEGLKAQSEEALEAAAATDAALVVAVTKCDKRNADFTAVRQALEVHPRLSARYAGDFAVLRTAATSGEGLDELRETALFAAEARGLEARVGGAAEALVLEARVEPGRGVVADVLVRHGRLAGGDHFVASAAWGTARDVRVLRPEMASGKTGTPTKKKIGKKARHNADVGPGEPAELTGFRGGSAPIPGDVLRVVKNAKLARRIAEQTERARRSSGPVEMLEEPAAMRASESSSASSATSATAPMGSSSSQEALLAVLLKCDVGGSLESLTDAFGRLPAHARVRIVEGSLGAVSEGDVALAHTCGARLYAYRVPASAGVNEAARVAGVPLVQVDVVYDLIEDLTEALRLRLPPVEERLPRGKAEVRKVFHIRTGRGEAHAVAGCAVTHGQLLRRARARVVRDGREVAEGNVLELKKLKEEVAEVVKGDECGIMVEGAAEDIREGDTIECFEVIQVPPKLKIDF